MLHQRLVAWGALVVAALLAPAPPEGVAILLHARIAYAPLRLTIPVHVDPHPDNRRLRLVAVCEGVVVSRGDRDLPGVAAPTLVTFSDWVLTDPCEYQLIADVWGVQRRQRRATLTLLLLASYP